MAFQTAGALALREAADQAGISLLEPYDEVSVLVADDLVGGVMSDLSSRRGRLLGTDQVGDRALVKAHVPSGSWSATPSTCARRRTAPARSAGPSPTTSRCRTTSRSKVTAAAAEPSAH